MVGREIHEIRFIKMLIFLKMFFFFNFRKRREKDRDREREEERGRRGGGKRGVRGEKRHQLAASCMPSIWGLSLQPRQDTGLQIEPVTSQCPGLHSTNRATLDRGINMLFSEVE